MAFNNYLEDENDKPYFTTNSLAYYYDKMEGFAKAVEGSAKALNLTKEEVEKRITLYINQNKNEQDQRHALNKNELDQRIAQWDGKLETFDSSVETLLTEWVDDGTLITIIDSALIDQKIAPVTAQLAETEKMMKLKSFPKYGSIDLSTYDGLKHTVDFNLWRDNVDSQVKHDWKLDQSGYEVRYVSATGKASNDGKTPETSWGNLSYALTTIEADSTLSKVKIAIKGWLRRNDTVVEQGKELTKKYILESEFPIGSNELMTYVTNPNGLKVAALSIPAIAVVRIDEKDVKGKPKEFVKVDSVDACLQTINSYYHDGSSIYINRSDTTNENTYVLVSDNRFYLRLSKNAEFIMNGITLLAGGTGNNFRFDSVGGVGGKMTFNNVTVIYYNVGTTANGLATDGIKDVKLFNCKVFNAFRDGFNYHNTKEKDALVTVFEYNCYAEKTGSEGVSTNNNISTAHEGMHIIRIATKGTKSRGPMIADVNGCYSLCIDCSVFDTRYNGLSWGQNAAYYFSDTASTFVTNPDGKAWLINCEGGSQTEWSINTDALFKANPSKLVIDNFKGNTIPNDLAFQLM